MLRGKVVHTLTLSLSHRSYLTSEDDNIIYLSLTLGNNKEFTHTNSIDQVMNENKEEKEFADSPTQAFASPYPDKSTAGF